MTPSPTTLAGWLRTRTDEQIADLLRLRPDLTRPLPEDLAGLAARAAAGVSVRLAWDRLNRSQQQLLEVLVALRTGPVNQADLQPGLADAVPSLIANGLLWGQPEELRAVSAVADLVGPYPCGLDLTDRSHRHRLQEYLANPQSLRDELAAAPPGVQQAIDQLLWGPPRGTLPNADRVITTETARTPVEWLLARDILIAEDAQTVVLPREVALILREGRYLPAVASQPPPPQADRPIVPDVDAAAGLQALTATRAVGRLLTALEADETRVLRTGGIYQRDAEALATGLRLPLGQLSLLADAAWSAGLIAADEQASRWGLTTVADRWRALDEPMQWAVLATGWLSSDRHAVLAATGIDPEARLLSTSLNVPSVRQIRALVLAAASRTAVSAVIDPDAVVDYVRWRRPRLDGPDLPKLTRQILADAEVLGVTGRGAVSAAGRVLADLDPEVAVVAGAVIWPSVVEQVIVQADLTATAFGPLSLSAQARLERLAEAESFGTGASYRFTAASLRAALDAGLSVNEIELEIAGLSSTPLPQSLVTLIQDVGRQHGSVRVTAAACVVTSDDAAALAAAVSDRTVGQLGLRLVAPGVAIATAPVGDVIKALRAAAVPAVGDETERPRRARRVPSPPPVTTQVASSAWVEAAVRSLRAGEASRFAAGTNGTGQVTPVGPHALVEVLQAAIKEGRSLWLDVSDPTGTRRVRRVDPLTLRSGVLSGFDHRDQRVAAFPLSRIAGIGHPD